MKRIAFLIMAAFITIAAYAGDYNYLTFKQTNGGEKSISLTNLKITFADCVLTAKNSTETQTYALSALSKMFFSSDVTGITSANTSNLPLAQVKGNMLYVNTASAKTVQIYDFSGRLLKDVPAATGNTQISMSNLSSGPYIVRVGKYSIKIEK